MRTYDSTEDTLRHIKTVQICLSQIVREIEARKVDHDASKLVDPEKSVFDEFTPKLKGSTYGSEEYKGFLVSMGEALKHHYENNRHHPEHYEKGIRDMDLVDIVEMFCDWKAATMRHDDGDIIKSIDYNQTRFGYGDDLLAIFRNTVFSLGW